MVGNVADTEVIECFLTTYIPDITVLRDEILNIMIAGETHVFTLFSRAFLKVFRGV